MASSQFEGLLTTLGGYVIIAAFLVLLYYVFSALQLHRIKRVFGFCYVVVKVGHENRVIVNGIRFLSVASHSISLQSFSSLLPYPFFLFFLAPSFSSFLLVAPHYGPEQIKISKNSHLIIHYPTSLGVSERCKQTSGWTSKWLSTSEFLFILNHSAPFPPQVSLLVIVEIGISPLICGWWLDICSLSLFDVTLGDRQSSFARAPGTTTFLHWLVGMVRQRPICDLFSPSFRFVTKN